MKFACLMFSLCFLLTKNFALALEEPKETNIQFVIDLAKSYSEASSKEDVDALLDELASSSVVIRTGTDKELRPIFVNAQAGIERALIQLFRSNRIKKPLWIIHTPAPATPLCSEGEISMDLIDPSLMDDPERILTVMKRPDIIRQYLKTGGCLISIYSFEERQQRTSEQLVILDNLKAHFRNLFTLELDYKIPSDLIGATYFFQIENEQFILSLKSYQANQPTDDQWAVWFGSIKNPLIQMRLYEFSDFDFLKFKEFNPES